METAVAQLYTAKNFMILVTGARGFIGRSLTNRLTLSGHKWRAYEGRINSTASLRTQLEGVETVFHLAGAEARGRTRLLRHIDVDGTARLLEEAKRAQVKQIIVPSRIGANPNSLHNLLKAKGEVERLVRQGGISYTILRTSTLYGLGDRFTEIILGLAIWSWPFVWLPGGGEVAMQPLWVEDYARCLVACLDNDDVVDKTITVAGDERFHYRDLVRQILSMEGVRRVNGKLPLILLRPGSAIFFGWWYWPPVSRFFVDRFFVPEVADLGSVRHYFGFRPMRLGETMSYLHRQNMRWRLFRR
ncbi:MAG: SDR family oxidoreductase [Candidatus Promineifilaceae bacterium]